MIGYCGYNCHLCATRSEDPNARQKLVDGWRKYFGHENYTVENVQCDGCLSDSRIADKMCKARPCAKKKAVENCALCDEFSCDKVKSLMAHRIGMPVYCSPKTFHNRRRIQFVHEAIRKHAQPDQDSQEERQSSCMVIMLQEELGERSQINHRKTWSQNLLQKEMTSQIIF